MKDTYKLEFKKRKTEVGVGDSKSERCLSEECKMKMRNLIFWYGGRLIVLDFQYFLKCLVMFWLFPFLQLFLNQHLVAEDEFLMHLEVL